MNFIEIYNEEVGPIEMGATKLSDDVYLFGYYDDYWFAESIAQKGESGFDIMSYRVEYDGIEIKGELRKLILNNMIKYLNHMHLND
jgi:hypothetical protein